MGIDYDLISEETPLTAASLNDRFQGLQTGVNALKDTDIEGGALRTEHLPGARLSSGKNLHTKLPLVSYDNIYPGSGVDTIGTGSGTYWKVISQSPNDLEVTGIAAHLDLLGFTNPNYTIGVLVLLNVNVTYLATSDADWDGHEPIFACFAIQAYLGGLSPGWKTIQKTERIIRNTFIQNSATNWIVPNLLADVSIRTLITMTDVAGWPDWDFSLQRVRAVVSVYAGSEAISAVGGTVVSDVGVTVKLTEANISAVSVRSGILG